jgi:hypothetical protein
MVAADALEAAATRIRIEAQRARVAFEIPEILDFD